MEEKRIVSHDHRDGNSNVRNVITKIIPASEPKKTTLIIPVFNIHAFSEERRFSWEQKYEKIETPLDVFFLDRVPHLCLVDGKETETFRRIRILARNEENTHNGTKKQVEEITKHIDEETINWRQTREFGIDKFGNEAHTDCTYVQIIEKEFEWLRDVYFQEHTITVSENK